MSQILFMRQSVFAFCLALACAVLFGAPAQAQSQDLTVPLSGAPPETSSPVTADFDGDGVEEIVLAGRDGRIYWIDGEAGRVRWERNLADYVPGYERVAVRGGLAVGDLQGDGALELVIPTGTLGPDQSNVPGAVIVLTYTGGRTPFMPLEGWPRMAEDVYPASRPDGMPDPFISTPALGDVDGDGMLEVVIGGYDRRIYVLRYDGTIAPGWPFDWDRGNWRDTVSSPALADIDSDGLPEIIIGSNNYRIPACQNPYLFYAFNGDGSFVPGFPVETNANTASSPAVGDIDGDGLLDIVVGTGSYDEDCGQEPNSKQVFAWNHQGQPKPGWPVSTDGRMEASPALGDLDGDGALEVVIGCHDVRQTGCNKVYAWHGNGRPVRGFPTTPFASSSNELPYLTGPALADIDGDGSVNILMPVQLGIAVLGPDGTLIDHGRRGARMWLPVGPVVADVDGDGLLETIAGGARSGGSAEGMLYIWQESGSAGGKLPWPMFHQNARRTGAAPLHSVSGQVLDSRSRPVAGALIRSDQGQRTYTDRQGNFELGGLTPGSHVLTPSLGHLTFRPAERRVSVPAGGATYDFTLTVPLRQMHLPVIQR